MKIKATALCVVLGVLLFMTCDNSPPFDVAAYAGSWTGTWNNTTFSSTGAASMTIAVDESAKTISVTIDLDGNVFGGSDPAAFLISGGYTNTAISFGGDSALFGSYTVSITPEGVVSGTLHPNPTYFHSATITGTCTDTSINITYNIYRTVTEPGDTLYATGTLTLTKS